MKNFLIISLTSLTLLLLINCQQSGIEGDKNSQNVISETHQDTLIKLFIEDECQYPFEKTIELIKSEVEKKTWRVTAIHDLQETLKKNGQDVLPVKVFAICHPKYSGQILSGDTERIVSPLMPCRLSVYQKSDGKSYISRMDPKVIDRMFTGKVAQVMKESANDVEDILEIILKKEK
jgi:uncharacterized protein (DUF302 family)